MAYVVMAFNVMAYLVLAYLAIARVEEVVDELHHHERVYLRTTDVRRQGHKDTRRPERHWRADTQCPISTTELEK